jgi:hypothetical protein
MFLRFFFILLLQFLPFFFFSQVLSSKEKKYLAESVLSDKSSEWYKIAINKDGFYKLTYGDLISYGISTNVITPSSIHIYGNALGVLPEGNNEVLPDDLVQNAIQYFGMEDGSFDAGDYILFYGFGPNKWIYSNGFFQRKLHIYSDLSYYFIRVSSITLPKIITPTAIVEQKPNYTSVDFDYFTIHEFEDTTLVNGGQRWYGELFDNILNRSVLFDFPSIPKSIITAQYSFASNASQSGNYLSISANNNVLSKTFLSTISSDFVRNQSSFTFTVNDSKVKLDLTLFRNNPSTKLFLDKIELNTRCLNQFSGQQYSFRDVNSVQKGGVTDYYIRSESPIFIWEITNKLSPASVSLGVNNNNGYNFLYSSDSLREFAVSSTNSVFKPDFIGRVNHQNLHGLDWASFIIVSPDEFLVPANRLADIHRGLGEKVHVIPLSQIYNEFSSGSVDPTAIKRCVKMFYDRFGMDATKSLKNLLLFGDGTFDPKNRVANNNYWVPTYQFVNSEDHLNAMVSDDYFGVLADDGSVYGKDSMQIGVGRMLISSLKIANEQIAKIEQYLRSGYVSDTIDCCGKISSTSFGDWRTNVVQIADDEEDGYFVNNDSEPQSQLMFAKHPELNVDKIYCDAYKQITMAGGERYPDVNRAIDDAISNGALLVNYIGHGGEVGAAEERVITIPQINSWNNFSKLPLFVSSTCEFTKYDDPSRVSAGEWLSLNPNGGAIALMTTTRPVFFSVNTATGSSFYKNVFERDQNNLPLTFGEILRRTKNMVYSDVNKHSFTLIGDPALRLALPKLRVIIDSINGFAADLHQDTIKALSHVEIKGHIEDQTGGQVLSGGVVYVRVFDKAKQLNTLGQDVDSPVITFNNQENILFKGRSKVVNGGFKIRFITPKDIDYSYGKGKLSLYFNDSVTDGIGSENRFQVGGISNLLQKDSVGPKISMYLNDESFVSSGLTNESPKLIIYLSDESGINTIGNGIGHDVVAVLDGNVSQPIVLNNFYVSDLNSFQKGRIVYDLKNLEEGRHTLQLKVWDVFNNPSESSIDFVVQKERKLELSHVLNYPNPFTTNTQFYFEHNQICNQLKVQIEVLTITGRLVKTIREDVSLQGFRSEGISWDGRDEFGDKLGKGVYVYRIIVQNSVGEKTEKIEKLVIL